MSAPATREAARINRQRGEIHTNSGTDFDENASANLLLEISAVNSSQSSSCADLP